MLIRDDLPTLDLPIKANSGISDFGHAFKEGLLNKNWASLISYSIKSQLYPVGQKLFVEN
jgi:hypothetical protein